MRFAHPATDDRSVLVPTSPDLPTQVVDVRDLASWLVRCVEHPVRGVYNVTGPTAPLSEHLAVARSFAGHTGPLIAVNDEWLVAHDVQEWAGPRSLPLWLPSKGWEGFAARSSEAADSARHGLPSAGSDAQGRPRLGGNPGR